MFFNFFENTYMDVKSLKLILLNNNLQLIAIMLIIKIIVVLFPSSNLAIACTQFQTANYGINAKHDFCV